MFYKITNKKIVPQALDLNIFLKKENTQILRRNKFGLAKGFSLIELIVVMAIFTIITSIVIFNYGKFSSNLVVTNLAYEGALAIRQAQVYGISVKQTKASQSSVVKKFDAAYGVSFLKTDTQHFYLFADSVVDNKRDDNSTEDEETFTLNGSNIVKYFCVTNSALQITCSDTGSLSRLSLIFKRPEPNAKIFAFGNTNVQLPGGGTEGTFTKAEIMFTSGRGDKISRVTVTNTGQISVDSCNAPGKTCPKEDF